jgi:ABC-type uncharacterized transport system permease subunit
MDLNSAIDDALLLHKERILARMGYNGISNAYITHANLWLIIVAANLVARFG